MALLDRSYFFPPKHLDVVHWWFVEYLIFVEGVVCLDFIEVIELAGPSLGFVWLRSYLVAVEAFLW